MGIIKHDLGDNMSKELVLGDIFDGVKTVSDIVKNLLKHDQPDIKTTHDFNGGMYVRTFFPEKNTFVVGKIHKYPGFNFLTKGAVTVYDGDKVHHFTAPATFKSPGNDQKIGFFTEESEFTFVSTCFANNVEDAEEELFYPDDTTIEQVRDWQHYNLMLQESRMTEEQIQEYVGIDNLLLGTLKNFKLKDSNIHGIGFFTTVQYNKGETLGMALVDGKRTELGRWVNDSANPNTYGVMDGDSGEVFASRDIQPGEEITISYIENIKEKL